MAQIPSHRASLTEDQKLLYDEIVARAAAEHRTDYATVLVAFAQVGNDPQDVEAVRWALFGPWRPTSSHAVWSLVIGLLAVVACPLPFMGVGAIVSGRRALNETRTGIKSGHGMAVAGLALGWFNTIFWLGVAVIAITVFVVNLLR